MKSLVIALAVAGVVAGVAYVLTETAAGFRSHAVIALNEDVATDQLDEARAEITDSLGSALERLAGEPVLDEGEVELFVPEEDSRVEVYATASSPSAARQLASTVAQEMWRTAIDVRQSDLELEAVELRSQLAVEQQTVEQRQGLVDAAIRDEAIATREVQEVSRVNGDTAALRAVLDVTIDDVGVVAAERDVVADEINRLQRRLIELEAERSIGTDALFVVRASPAENVSGSPRRNALEAFAIALVTASTALAVLHLGKRS